jgi:hypothetical protein
VLGCLKLEILEREFSSLHLSYKKGIENQYAEEVSKSYPFGMAINQVHNGSVTKNRFLYQTKELNKTMGLYWYDFHARQYDARNSFLKAREGRKANPLSTLNYSLTE